MNYLDLIRKFWQLDATWQFGCCESRLYFYLVEQANRLGWPDNFTHSDARTSINVGVSPKSLRAAKNRLMQAGLISFSGGGKGRADKCKYTFRCSNLPPIVPPNGTPKGTPNGTPKTDDTSYIEDKLNQTYNTPYNPPLQGEEVTGIPEEFVTLWDGFKGKRKSLADDYNDFCKKTDGLTIDYVKLGYHAQLAKNVYFQTWLNDFFPKKFRCTLDTSVVEPTFQPIVADWLAYKSERGQTYRQRGFESFYARLMELSGGNADTARGIIEQSKANNWAGIFPLKTTNDYGRNADNRVAHCDITSDEFMRRCEERVRARLARTMAREMGTDGGGDA